MKVIGIIPARYGATRFPGKPLALINGKPLVYWVWTQAKKSRSLDDVIVATDDHRIKQTVESFGGDVVLTSETCVSGTDRVAEVARKINSDIVVNIQGDEPLISPVTINRTVRLLVDSGKNVSMATPVTKITDQQKISNPNLVKVVLDKNNFALYFSRSVIPYFSGKLNKDLPCLYK